MIVLDADTVNLADSAAIRDRMHRQPPAVVRPQQVTDRQRRGGGPSLAPDIEGVPL